MVRMKQLWEVVPLPSKIKLVWARITSSRLATSYFILTVVHCLVQIAFQTAAHVVNTNAANLLTQLIDAGGMQSRNFTLWDEKTRTLSSCWGIPSEGGEKCITVWSANDSTALDPDLKMDGYWARSSTAKPSSTSTSATQTASPVVSLTAGKANLVNNAAGDNTSSSSQAPVTVTQTVVITQIPTSASVIVSAEVEPTSTPDVHDLLERHDRNKRSITITAMRNSNSTLTGFMLKGLTSSSSIANISTACAEVQRWPLQTLQNTQRQDIVFIAFQIWVLGMSFVALLNESIPHTIAALLTHVLATMWSGYQLANTKSFRQNFVSLTVNGACDGVSVLPNYWRDRGAIEIALLVLNGVALVASALLSWKIVKAFGWATFRRIGADRKVNRVYKIVLLMTVFLQLSLFFIVTSMALWIDQLCGGYIGKFSSHMELFRGIDIAIFILLVPWLALGWFGVRRENKKMMYGFFALSVLFLAEWASAFISDAWRLTFLTWQFFALMAIVAAALTVSVTVLGVMCFRNFGEGLSNYLKPDDPLEGVGFERIDPDVEAVSRTSSETFEEKVAFPEMGVLPAYSLPKMVPPAPPAPAAKRTSDPSRGMAGTRAASIASSGRRTENPFQRDSIVSNSTHASDTDPFYLAEKLSIRESVRPSRWSRDSDDKKPKISGKRWVIE